MKEIIHNKDNLMESEITEIVVRCKALIINNNNLLLANADNVLQFPGGHLEKDETLKECLIREIREETGIIIDNQEVKDPILKVISQNKDWPYKGNNRKCEIYYYVIKTTKLPNLDNIHLTKDEKEKNFKVDFIPLDESIKYIEENMPRNEKNYAISPDMISAITEYLKA